MLFADHQRHALTARAATRSRFFGDNHRQAGFCVSSCPDRAASTGRVRIRPRWHIRSQFGGGCSSALLLQLHIVASDSCSASSTSLEFSEGAWHALGQVASRDVDFQNFATGESHTDFRYDRSAVDCQSGCHSYGRSSDNASFEAIHRQPDRLA